VPTSAHGISVPPPSGLRVALWSKIDLRRSSEGKDEADLDGDAPRKDHPYGNRSRHTAGKMPKQKERGCRRGLVIVSGINLSRKMTRDSAMERHIEKVEELEAHARRLARHRDTVSRKELAEVRRRLQRAELEAGASVRQLKE
jgi:hypothetical protein